MKLTANSHENDLHGYNATLGRRYAMLPLDEEHFKIDANSRIITVPESFRKNGIAVQGDEVAEVVYFKINRYFDFMDLNNTYIIIQWKLEGRTDEGVSIEKTGTSMEWVRDIESEPDYLIFGWALDSSITQYQGNLKFSVRFVNLNENDEDDIENGTIEYSLSTLEATATINKALNFQLDSEILSELKERNSALNNKIMSRVKSLQIMGTDEAALPIYTLTLADWVKQNENSGTYIYTVDLVDGEYLFKVQAFSEDAGYISYKWYNGKTELENIDIYEPVVTEELNAINKYFLPKEEHLYYVRTGSGTDESPYVYELPDSMSKDEQGRIDLTSVVGKMLYERFGSFIATEAGKYFAVAKNEITHDHTLLPDPNTKDLNTPNKYGPITIPGPDKTTFGKDGGNNYILYDGSYETTLDAEIINETAQNFEYKWYKDSNKDVIEGSASTLTIRGDSSYPKDKQGAYQLEVTAYRNNTPDYSTTEPFIVTYHASPIQEVELKDEKNNVLAKGDRIGINETIIVNPILKYDYQINNYSSFAYQWEYEVENEDDTLSYRPIKEANSQHFNIPSNFYDAETNELIGNPGQAVRCVVTNNYNGTSTFKETVVISIKA